MPSAPQFRRVASRYLPDSAKDAIRSLIGQIEALSSPDGDKASPGSSASSSPKKGAGSSATPGAEALLAELRRGGRLEDAVARSVRSQLSRKQLAAPQQLADSLLQDENTRKAGHLAAGLVAHHRKHVDAALHHFDGVAEDDLLRNAAVEWIHCLFAAAADRGTETAERWISSKVELPARTWFEVYRQLFVHDQLDAAAEAFALAQAAYATPEAKKAWPSGKEDLAWGRRWSAPKRFRVEEPSSGSAVRFGLIGYEQPGRARASQNIGDQIQTLASLGHVVRHQGLRFHGDEDLVDFVEEMQRRVRPELRRTTLDADVDLVTVDRDSTTYQSFAPDTWLIEFGWHMHALFGLDVYDFPLHPHLNPIFVSFHCSKRELLTPEAIDYLKQHGPIGCRDWTTVDLLLSLDVPAFFSGCLTTTVNTVFPDLEQSPREATAYVDVSRSPVPAGHENIRQSYPEIKRRTFVENMRDAVQVLEGYRLNYTKVVTTRLHCYLPTTSIGLTARFEPKNNADVRFAGLFRLTTEQFDAMRSSMRDRLEPVLTAIFEGKDRETVYSIWSETVGSEVEAARRRHEDVAEIPADHELVTRLSSTIRPAGTVPEDGRLDVVLTPRSEELNRLRPVIASAAEASSLPLRVWILSDSSAPVSIEVPGADVRWVDTSGADLAASGVRGRRALDRTLLAEILPVDRVILLPVDALVVGDLAELAATDLNGRRVAARGTSRSDGSGFGVLYSAARRLDPEPDVAFELYRRMHRSHLFDFDAFDTDVMVMDLAGLRADSYAATVIPAMRRYRFDDRDALHFTVGRNWTVLDAKWAHVPSREHLESPAVVHWADSTKPWSAEFSPRSASWRELAV